MNKKQSAAKAAKTEAALDTKVDSILTELGVPRNAQPGMSTHALGKLWTAAPEIIVLHDRALAEVEAIHETIQAARTAYFEMFRNISADETKVTKALRRAEENLGPIRPNLRKTSDKSTTK